MLIRNKCGVELTKHTQSGIVFLPAGKTAEVRDVIAQKWVDKGYAVKVDKKEGSKKRFDFNVSNSDNN